MDEIDRANRYAYIELEAQLARARQLAQIKPPKATGRCLYCEQPLPEGRRFCDTDCAQDYQTYGPA